MFISIQLYLSLLLSYLLELCIVYEDCTSHTCKNKAQTKSYCCLILVSCVHNMKGSHYTVIIIVQQDMHLHIIKYLQNTTWGCARRKIILVWKISRKISISICVGVVSLVIWLTVWVLLVRVWIVDNKEHLTLLVYLDSDKCMIEHYIEYRMLIICLTHSDMNILIYTDSVYWFLHSSLMYLCNKTTRLS